MSRSTATRAVMNARTRRLMAGSWRTSRAVRRCDGCSSPRGRRGAASSRAPRLGIQGASARARGNVCASRGGVSAGWIPAARLLPAPRGAQEAGGHAGRAGHRPGDSGSIPAMPRTLVVQIPCHNEEATLPGVLADLPSSIPGIGRIIPLIIDDGSTDGTAAVARGLGAEVLKLPVRRGLARGYLAGLDRAIELGADVIVNTDGDGQYRGSDIPALV